MAFRHPFSQVTVANDVLSVCHQGDWFVVRAIQGVPSEKVIKVAASLDDGDNAEHMLSTNMSAVMEALGAPLSAASLFTVEADGEEMPLQVDCPSSHVEQLETKLDAVKSAFQGVLSLAGTLGATPKDITTAFMLACSSDVGDVPMGAMGAPPQCQQQ